MHAWRYGGGQWEGSGREGTEERVVGREEGKWNGCRMNKQSVTTTQCACYSACLLATDRYDLTIDHLFILLSKHIPVHKHDYKVFSVFPLL